MDKMPDIRGTVQIGKLTLSFGDIPSLGPGDVEHPAAELDQLSDAELDQFKDHLLDELNKVRRERARRKRKS